MVPNVNDKLIMSLIVGATMSMCSLSKAVQTGLISQDFVAAVWINLLVSSKEISLKADSMIGDSLTESMYLGSVGWVSVGCSPAIILSIFSMKNWLKSSASFFVSLVGGSGRGSFLNGILFAIWYIFLKSV